MTTVAGRVAAGAALLDEKDPGWHERIDLGTLRMASSCDCVLGQLCPPELGEQAQNDPYGAYVMELAGCLPVDSEEWAVERGFLTHWTEDSYAGLTAEWKRVIGERRAAQ